MGKKGYFLSDWTKSLEKNPKIETGTLHSRVPDRAHEVYNLGLKILELNGISKRGHRSNNSINNVKLYNGEITNMMSELKLSEKLKNILQNMLEKDVEKRAKLDSLIQGVEGSVEYEQETKRDEREAAISVEEKKETKIADPLKSLPFKLFERLERKLEVRLLKKIWS